MKFPLRPPTLSRPLAHPGPNTTTTKFVLFLSPAGSGKTTTIKNMVLTFGVTLKIAVLFNDDGDEDATDLPEEVSRFADVDSMTSGCFGCHSVDDLVAKLEELDGKVDLVLVEPIGFTAAEEMLAAFSKARKSPIVVTLLDAENLTANLRIGTLEGQISAADLVLLTKDTDLDLRAAAIEFAEIHAMPEVPIRSLHQHAPLALEEAGSNTLKLRFVKPSATTCDSGCGHNHSRDHHHKDQDHNHGHVHAIVTYHTRLRPGVNLTQVREVIDRHPGVLRVKVRTGGEQCAMTQGTWEPARTAAPQAVTFITFYTQTTAEGDPCMEELTPFRMEKRYASLGTADEVRDVEGKDLGLLEELIAECEAHGVTCARDGHPVPNTERQELLNEVRKRKSVPEALSARAVRARVQHHLNCGEWYHAHPEREDEPAAALRFQAIPVCIAWFCSEQPERISDDLRARATKLPLVRWLAKGLLARTKLNADAAREEVIADEAGITARWGRQHRLPISPEEARLLADAYRHNLELAHASMNDRVIAAWEKVRTHFMP